MPTPQQQTSMNKLKKLKYHNESCDKREISTLPVCSLSHSKNLLFEIESLLKLKKKESGLSVTITDD
jgi:hypothetical protein